MSEAFEQSVRLRAYEIWMQSGRVDGHAAEHWTIAETDIRARLTAAAQSAAMPAPVAPGLGTAKGAVKANATTGKATKPKVAAAKSPAKSANQPAKSAKQPARSAKQPAKSRAARTNDAGAPA